MYRNLIICVYEQAHDTTYYFFQLRNIHGTIMTRVHKLVMDDGHGLYFTIVNNIILPVMRIT